MKRQRCLAGRIAKIDNPGDRYNISSRQRMSLTGKSDYFQLLSGRSELSALAEFDRKG